MKKFLFLPSLFFVICTNAQTYLNEALLFSRSSVSGTARSVGVAGAFGSVGADLGSVALNPAGLGLYRSTDFSFTPAFLIHQNKAQFLGSNSNSSGNRIYFNQAGVSFTKLFGDAKKRNEISFSSAKFTSFTFAINYQRQSMFERSQTFDGLNTNNSAISYITTQANTNNSLDTDDYPVGVLAYNVYLINQDTVTGEFISGINAPLRQSGSITTKGAIDHIDIAFGGNVNDKFYFGAGLGLSILTHSYNAAFSEYGSRDTGTYFNDYTVDATLRNTGLGINSKFGIIYRPASWLRLGVAYHIPSFYSVSENYAVNMYAYYDTANLASGATGNPFRYKLRTPMKGIISASYYFKEYGFFSVDYEFLNYGSSKYDFGKDYQNISNQINADIKKYYAFGHVIRAGIEGAYKALRVRGGYSYAGTPYKKDFSEGNFTETRHTASAGIGYRGNRFYADVAYLFSTANDRDLPYADFVVSNTAKSHHVYITLGWKMNKAAPKTTKAAKSRKMHF